MEKTLLEKAREIVKPNRMSTKYSEEDEELIWAWASGEVSLAAINKTKFDTGSGVKNPYCYICYVLRQMVRDKDIILSSKSKK